MKVSERVAEAVRNTGLSERAANLLGFFLHEGKRCWTLKLGCVAIISQEKGDPLALCLVGHFPKQCPEGLKVVERDGLYCHVELA